MDKSVEKLLRSIQIDDIPKVLMEWEVDNVADTSYVHIIRKNLRNHFVNYRFQLDLNMMPLGKLSQNTINAAFSILVQLKDHFDTHGRVDRSIMMRCTHKFYELVPHAVGNRNLSELNSINRIEVCICDF